MIDGVELKCTRFSTGGQGVLCRGMTRLTLDEAIRQVLVDAGRGLTVAEITRIVRERKLYLRQDGNTPERSQISVRIYGRPALFHIDRSTYPSTIRIAAGNSDPAIAASAPEMEAEHEPEETISASAEWWWEGNIQARVAEYLSQQGWTVKSRADTAARARGADIIAHIGERTLIVEVKGYPSTVYSRGPQAGRLKRTKPRLQARHWFADALLGGMLHRESSPHSEVALAFPDVDRYRKLISRTETALHALGLGVYLVPRNGPPKQRIRHQPH